jgi:hypothetical protein
LRRHNERIELVPVPHPGTDVHPQVTVNYRPIQWGARIYLSPTDQHELGEFCRAALPLSRQAKFEYIEGSYLRESDLDKPRTGLPHLPADVWVKFVADEISLNNEQGSLRLALNSLIPRYARARR